MNQLLASETRGAGVAVVSALATAAEAVTEVARIAKGSAVIADTAKRARASIAEVPRWLPWLLLGVLGFGILVGLMMGRPRRKAEEPAAEVAEPATETIDSAEAPG